MYDLKALRTATDKACCEAFAEWIKFGEAIIWDDLGCTSARYVIDDEGREMHQVVISEAAPECFRFHSFVREQLCKAGFRDVEVLTEW